jgi:ribosomal protein S18 acetylase RimI-like enzyme
MTRTETTIRRATPADVAEVARLGGALVRQHHAYDPRRFVLFDPLEEGLAEFYREQLDRPDALLLAAGETGTVAGFSFARLEPEDLMIMRPAVGCIHDLYVDPAARGGGLGARLLDAAIDGLRQLGSAGVMLVVAPQNEPARKLFRRRGFRCTIEEMRLD